MPETPDFEQLARAVVPFCLGVKDADDVKEACALVAEQLRLVWNARGAADLSTINDVAHTNEKAIERAIRSLDR